MVISCRNPSVSMVFVSSVGVCVGFLVKVPWWSPNLREDFSEAVSSVFAELCSLVWSSLVVVRFSCCDGN